MDFERKTRQISNSYYNLGLERAKIRDLTGAVGYLKKSLHFYKYNTEARNLLGLIYYEIGEVAEALTQWVISMNLTPQDNRADYYLDEIQRKSGRLEVEDLNIKKFNQALDYAQNGNEDLAILQLSRVVDVKPNYVKAHLVLALLYMSHEDYVKAGKSLFKVLQIDKNNPKGQWYMSIVKSNTGKAEVEKIKLKNAFSHRQMQDDDIIIPPSYKENYGWQTILNIIVGLCLGAAVIFFVVLPAKTRADSAAHNRELIASGEKLNAKNLEVDRLNSNLAELTKEKEDAESKLNAMTSDSGNILNQYQTLIGILQAYKKDDFQTVVTLYSGLDSTIITDADVLAIVAEIRTDMQQNGYQVLSGLGDTAAAGGNPQGALDYYQKSLNINPGNWEVKYKMALVYKSQNESDKANEILGDIIVNSKNEQLTEKAKAERGF